MTSPPPVVASDVVDSDVQVAPTTAVAPSTTVDTSGGATSTTAFADAALPVFATCEEAINSPSNTEPCDADELRGVHLVGRNSACSMPMTPHRSRCLGTDRRRRLGVQRKRHLRRLGGRTVKTSTCGSTSSCCAGPTTPPRPTRSCSTRRCSTSVPSSTTSGRTSGTSTYQPSLLLPRRRRVRPRRQRVAAPTTTVAAPTTTVAAPTTTIAAPTTTLATPPTTVAGTTTTGETTTLIRTSDGTQPFTCAMLLPAAAEQPQRTVSRRNPVALRQHRHRQSQPRLTASSTTKTSATSRARRQRRANRLRRVLGLHHDGCRTPLHRLHSDIAASSPRPPPPTHNLPGTPRHGWCPSPR